MDRLTLTLQFQGNRLTQWAVLLPLPTGSSVCLPWVITVAQSHKSTVTPLCQPGNKSVGQPVSKFSQWAKLTAADGSVDLVGQTGQGPGRRLLRAAISQVNNQQECVETRQSTETLMLWIGFLKEKGEIQLANPNPAIQTLHKLHKLYFISIVHCGVYNQPDSPHSSMNERLCYWLMGQSGDHKDAIRFYSRIIWPLFALFPFSPAPCG